jgi:hypothetical protein
VIGFLIYTVHTNSGITRFGSPKLKYWNHNSFLPSVSQFNIYYHAFHRKKHKH